MSTRATRIVRRLIAKAGARLDASPAIETGAPPELGDREPDHRDDVVLFLCREEFEQLGSALRDIIEGAAERPASPALLEAALSVAIARRSGFGTPTVWRQPAGLHTPETWQVRLARADRGTRAALLSAAHGGAFA
jgi:hypothetical protein